MSVTTPVPSLAPVRGSIGAGLSFSQLNNGLWRITRADGSVLGYVEQPTAGSAGGYTAKRLSPDRRSFRVVGEFRTFEDALASLRFS